MANKLWNGLLFLLFLVAQCTSPTGKVTGNAVDKAAVEVQQEIVSNRKIKVGAENLLR